MLTQKGNELYVFVLAAVPTVKLPMLIVSVAAIGFRSLSEDRVLLVRIRRNRMSSPDYS